MPLRTNPLVADNEPLLRQNSHFLWAVGANESGFYVAINVDDGKATLFVPKLPESYGIWMGALKTPAEIAAAYGVEEGKFVTEMHSTLKAASPTRVLLNVGLNTDSGATSVAASWEGKQEFVDAGVVDVDALYPVLTECRVFKTDREIAVMRQIVGAASDAHCVMMRAVREGMREDGLEAVFKFWLQSTVGARYNAYTYICGSGPNAAVLHYGHEGAPNDRFIGKDEFVLCDCGHELFGYASDITTAFPSTGKFTPDQRVIYSAVLGEARDTARARDPRLGTTCHRHGASGCLALDARALRQPCPCHPPRPPPPCSCAPQVPSRLWRRRSSPASATWTCRRSPTVTSSPPSRRQASSREQLHRRS